MSSRARRSTAARRMLRFRGSEDAAPAYGSIWFWGPVVLSGLLVSLYFTYRANQQAELFFPLLVGNTVAAIFLFAFIVYHLWGLYHDWRLGQVGSRLAVRLVLLIGILSVTPAAVVFGFSWHLLNQGIDAWFGDEVREALEQAVEVSERSLEELRRNAVLDARLLASELAQSAHPLETLIIERDRLGFSEATLLSKNGKFIATSSALLKLTPTMPGSDMMKGFRHGTATILETDGSGSQRLLILQEVPEGALMRDRRLLFVIQPVPRQMTVAANSIQVAAKRYQQMEQLREPMTTAFNLSLSVVVLLTALTALWLGLSIARRMVSPLGDLAAATRQVAKGEYAQIPIGRADDELQVLIHSFNSMTRLIAQSRRQVEARQLYLETMLSHLSSGVMTFDPKGELTTMNAAVQELLHPAIAVGTPVQGLAKFEGLDKVGAVIEGWVVNGENGKVELALANKKVLQVQGVVLPKQEDIQGNSYMVVVDDIAPVIQGQRAAAWREVARRLAHEIKNPLTPIQLSAERLRRKYLEKLGDSGEALDKATRTIINQVETLKEMVDAFSLYARQPQSKKVAIDLNALIQETMELYKGHPSRDALQLDLDLRLGRVLADASQIRQILHNLIQNALDATAGIEPARIMVQTGEMGRYGQLVVQDNGPGFPRELLDRIFEPYITSKAKGTGLGLAVVKKIVEDHGGTVTAGNTGLGACVTITLPLAENGQGESGHA